MGAPAALFRFIARSLLNKVGFGIAGDFAVDVLPEIARDVWQRWRKGRGVEEIRLEIEAVAQASAQEARQQAADAAAEVAQEAPPERREEFREAAQAYLTLLPGSIRRSMRRPEDPSGTTVPPTHVPRSHKDLVALLPSGMPRFKPGDPAPSGDWRLEQLLGVGGFGEVWLARHPRMRSMPPVALKFCLDADTASALRREEGLLDRVMAQGRNPGIVKLRNTYLSGDPPFLEYEYVGGGDLPGLIRQWHAAGKGCTPQIARDAAKVTRRLAEIVGSAHRADPPIVHRDLKPANILLCVVDGQTQFKVCDFGIGGVAAGQAIQATLHGQSQGAFLAKSIRGSCTPLYASPQQMRGDPPDPRDDIFALGVIWYQLLTGDLAQGRPGGRAWAKRLRDQGLSPAMLDCLEQCFEEDRDDRFADAAALAEALARAMEQEAAASPGQHQARPQAAAAPKPTPAPLPAHPKPPTPPQKPRPHEDLITNSIGLKLKLIQPGIFIMGELLNGPPHRVTITKPFYIGIYPVTQDEYERVTGSNPSGWPGSWRPVERVSWDDAQAFYQKLSEMAGLEYRLPTEAEWEYACRAGSTTAYCFGDDQARLGDHAWYERNSGRQTHEVGLKKPNAWGLCDMHGNVWEWCRDWYGDYRTEAQTNPEGPRTGDVRVLRGGSWGTNASICRSASRSKSTPRYAPNYLGFRVARPLA